MGLNAHGTIPIIFFVRGGGKGQRPRDDGGLNAHGTIPMSRPEIPRTIRDNFMNSEITIEESTRG